MAPALCAKSSFTKGSSLRAAATRPRVAVRRTVKVAAKYGDESTFFDLKDIENTTGSWDMYGQDSEKRYPSLQNEFFNRAAEPLSRRESLRTFVLAVGLGAIATFGYKGAKDAKLPITVGPLTSGENGKGGSIRNRL